jgi:hypothetical protein
MGANLEKISVCGLNCLENIKNTHLFAIYLGKCEFFVAFLAPASESEGSAPHAAAMVSSSSTPVLEDILSSQKSSPQARAKEEAADGKGRQNGGMFDGGQKLAGISGAETEKAGGNGESQKRPFLTISERLFLNVGLPVPTELPSKRLKQALAAATADKGDGEKNQQVLLQFFVSYFSIYFIFFAVYTHLSTFFLEVLIVFADNTRFLGFLHRF